MKISVAIITFNEEKNIERCILSVQKVADEIIVVDSFSKDNTENICKKHGVNFVQHAFEGHKEQKNYVASLANYEYVLSLDADEELSALLTESILDIKQNNQANSSDAYQMNRLNNFCGKWIKHSGWYPDKKIRLWKKGTASWKGTNPHDKLITDDNIKVTHINGDLLHYSFTSINQHINQINFFTDISSKEAYKKGKKTSSFKIIYKTIFKFIRHYILLGGFLDGYYGFVIAVNSAHAVFQKQTKLKELNKNKI